MDITGISRRRLQSDTVDDAHRRRLQSSADVEFAVTATTDVSDAMQPAALSIAFVAAVQRDPEGALATLSADDVAVQEPQITTTIDYTVVMPNDEMAMAAAQTLADDSAVVAGVSATVPGITASPNQPAPPQRQVVAPSQSWTVAQSPPATVQDEEEEHSFTAVLAIVVLVIVGSGVAFAYMQHRKLGADVAYGKSQNPLFADFTKSQTDDSGEGKISVQNPLRSIHDDDGSSSDDEEGNVGAATSSSDDEADQAPKRTQAELLAAVSIGATYKAVAAGIIRSGVDLGSEKVGSLAVGDELVALETDLVGHTLRVRFDRGWASVFSKSGKCVLKEIGSAVSGPAAYDLGLMD